MTKSKVDPEVAARIRAAILAKGVKLAVFARDADMPYPSLMDYYKGARKPGFDALAKIIDYSGVSPEWLLFGTGSMMPSSPPIQEQILGHIMQILGYAQHRLASGEWSVQEDSSTHLYAIQEPTVRNQINDLGELAIMSASIYNRVAHLQNHAERETQIQEEVRQMLRLKMSFSASQIPKPDSS